MRAGADNRFAARFVAQPSRDPYRPKRITRKPIVHGPQTWCSSDVTEKGGRPFYAEFAWTFDLIIDRPVARSAAYPHGTRTRQVEGKRGQS